jgi:diamine N-acetyltransferase
MDERKGHEDRPPVSLREITGENIKAVLSLRVTDAQRDAYPRSNAYSIAEGHYPPDDDPVWMRAVYTGETPVGFLMTSEAPDQGVYFLWRLMIGAKYQGKGYGRRAVELLIERIKALGNVKELLTSHLKSNCSAGAFFQELGFVYTGEILNGSDLLMKRDFLQHKNQGQAKNGKA